MTGQRPARLYWYFLLPHIAFRALQGLGRCYFGSRNWKHLGFALPTMLILAAMGYMAWSLTRATPVQRALRMHDAARSAHAKGDQPAAQVLMNASIALHPQPEPMEQELANWLLDSDPDQAQQIIHRLILRGYEPAQIEEARRIANDPKVDEQRIRQGLALIAAILRKRPTDPTANLLLAEFVLRAGQFENAVEPLKMASVVHPRADILLGETYQRLGRNVSESMERINGGIRRLEESLRKNPDDRDNIEALARGYVLTARLQSAEQLLRSRSEAALDLRETLAKLQLDKLQYMQRQMGPLANDSQELLMNDVIGLLDGDSPLWNLVADRIIDGVPVALQAFDTLDQRLPNIIPDKDQAPLHSGVALVRALVEIVRQRPANAWLDYAIKRDINRLPFVLRLYQSEPSLQSESQFIERLRSYVELHAEEHPEKPLLKVFVAEIAMAMGDEEKASVVFRDGMQHPVDEVAATFRASLSRLLAAKADFFFRKGDLDNSLRAASQAVTLIGSNREAAKSLVRIASKNDPNHSAAAEGLLERLAGSRADGASSLILLADLRIQQKRLDEAIVLLKQARDLDPHDAVALNNLAWCLSHVEPADLDQALELAKQATELLPDSFDVLETKAEILRRKERLEEAALTYQQALKVRPTARGTYPLLDALLTSATP
jgi:tetratricopeptide (TPR) repeat protein